VVANTSAGPQLYVADSVGAVVLRVDLVGNLTQVAGTGEINYQFGEGTQGLRTALNGPQGVAYDAATGSLLFADAFSNCVRRYWPENSTLQPEGGLAGRCGDLPAYVGDGGPARDASLAQPTAVSGRPDGQWLVADYANHRVALVARNGTISTLAGVPGRFGRDDGPVAVALLSSPIAAVSSLDGFTVFIASHLDHCIRRLVGGYVTTVASICRKFGYSGDATTGAATSPKLNRPADLAVHPVDGSLYIADSGNHRVRRLVLPAAGDGDGTITTVAGNGVATPAPDGLPPLRTQIDTPVALHFMQGVALTSADGAALGVGPSNDSAPLLFIRCGTSRLLALRPSDSTVVTVIGQPLNALPPMRAGLPKA